MLGVGVCIAVLALYVLIFRWNWKLGLAILFTVVLWLVYTIADWNFLKGYTKFEYK